MIMKITKHNAGLGLLIAAIVMVVSSAAALPPPTNVPDAGSTGLLLAGAFAGLAAVRRWLGR